MALYDLLQGSYFAVKSNTVLNLRVTNNSQTGTDSLWF
jgi:hypothetical protein